MTVPKKKTILVVEDDAVVRQFVRLVLEGDGYFVLDAGDGRQALEQAARYHGKIDLLCTDLVMPHVNGVQLAKALSVQRQTMRTLYMSGYAEDIVARLNVLSLHYPLLRKPFTPFQLLDHIRTVLQHPVTQGGPSFN